MHHLPRSARRYALAGVLTVFGTPATSAPAAPQAAAGAVSAVGRSCEAAKTGRASHEGWNGDRARSIARSVIDARRHAFAARSLESFEAHAEGHVRYLADLGRMGGEQLLRADQVALDVRWEAPGDAVQTIVGRRHFERLPVRIRYHIDHLSLVLDDLGNRIRIGEGAEVRDVLHPAAPGALEFYEYRLADSLGIRVGGEHITVYRLEVRPACVDSAGLVGTIDVDRASRAIARLAGTFTPASYVDERLDHVSLELASGYVGRRYWLPIDQRVEIRRELEWLDVPIAGVIRTHFRVLRYDLDPEPAPALPPGQRVVSLPEARLHPYVGWQSGLFEGMNLRGEPTVVDLAEVRRRAVSIAAGRDLGGNAPLRVHLEDLSSAIRVRRAEGLLVGAGARWRIDGLTALTVWTGYAFARERPEASLSLTRGVGPVRIGVEAYAGRLSDIGPFPVASGAVATIGFLARGEDFMDPHFRSGSALFAEWPLFSGHVRLGAAFEEHEAAALVGEPIADVPVRAIRPIIEGSGPRIEGRYERELGTVLGARVAIRGAGEAMWLSNSDALEDPGFVVPPQGGVAPRGQFDPQPPAGDEFTYTRWRATLEARTSRPHAPWAWEAEAGAGLATGHAPPQGLLLLGGRGTVPGYPFRGWAGDRAAYAGLTVSRAAWKPWLRLRLRAASGWSRVAGPGEESAAALGLGDSDGVRTALGGGVSLLWDMLRIDAVRGLDGGRWEWIVSINPSFRAPL